MDIITGKFAPADRLPLTQYLASYINEAPMTDMSLRPGPNNPGRTYKWYNGTAIFEFEPGMHYTNFTTDHVIVSTPHIPITVPSRPHRFKAKLSRSSLFNWIIWTGTISQQSTRSITTTANLNLILGSLARVDESGNKVLYSGDYILLIDNQPLASVNFTLTGDQIVLDQLPQPPANRIGKGVNGFEDYFVGGYGSRQSPMRAASEKP
ncbi:uncharacterized protein BDR25DRAFT_350240 [Lindgomyces ingoldianus]|uniref:Uncharacterized protein n=1 Tax=Lindgomyces ingoldianus TaxID=673940 RepID=A0ACB6RC98_9PLEO|nr:uncharacterized protein BDR25DRAFT_350240 [Lindgomyces ingoldianus]KAF2475955.1 hypothetical protein BDR25DRAFT_350240 [Lindgomyces ingoldianus]